MTERELPYAGFLGDLECQLSAAEFLISGAQRPQTQAIRRALTQLRELVRRERAAVARPQARPLP